MSPQRLLLLASLPALLLVSISTMADEGTSSGPRPISEIERHAAELALGYLESGPEAWWLALGEGAPLLSLGHEEALRELDVRAGARKGAHWTLRALPQEVTAQGLVAFTIDYPSGLDETLFLQLKPDAAGGWDLENVRILSEPLAAEDQSAGDAGTTTNETLEEEAGSSSGRSKALGTILPIPPWTLALAFVLVAITSAALTRKRKLLAVGLVSLGAAAATVTLLLTTTEGPPPGSSEGEATAQATFAPRLASLLPLRRALTSREGPAGMETVSSPPVGSAAFAVARLWQAHHDLVVGGKSLDLLKQDLEGMTDPVRYPFLDLLRARIELYQGTDPSAAAFFYERAAANPKAHDGLLVEAAQALFSFGLDLEAGKILRQAEAMGSRDADIYYSLQALALYRGQPKEAEKAFLVGWRLAAVDRQDLFSSPFFGALMGNQEVLDRLQLSSVEEPIGQYETLASRALTAPAGALVELTSERLRFFLGAAVSGDEGTGERPGRSTAGILEIFGGSEIAPFDTRLVGPSTWRLKEEREALEELASLGEAGRAPGAFALPSLVNRISTATEALAKERRWSELVELTEGLVEGQVEGRANEAERAPTQLVRLRAVALERLKRKDEARSLLLSLAKNVAASHRRDPGVLFQLADHFADAGDYDLAMRFARKANGQMPPLFTNTQRLDRYRMDQRLATSYQEHHSPHFDLRYPPDRAGFLAQRLAGVLEEEHQRMQRWIPLANAGVTEVHLIPFDDFMEAFGRSIEIIGLFDGRIRLPMADLSLLNREIVSIISHELAHAMIAEATADQAPFWLQEGLAQHAEMRFTTANPMPAYAAASGTFSLSSLESILRGFPHPKLVAQAYDQACWTVHFIEAKHGRRAIHGLLTAFRKGQTTEQALETVFGASMAEFDQALYTWWVNDAPRAWETETRDYRLYERRLIQQGTRRRPASQRKGS